MPWQRYDSTLVKGPITRLNDIAVAKYRRWAVSSVGQCFAWKRGTMPKISALPGGGHGRCIGFEPRGRIGWVGRFITPDAELPRLLKTTDGGAKWTPVEGLPPDPVEGLCGLAVLDRDLAFACGTFQNAGRPGCWRTTNGCSWHALGLPDDLRGLTDVRFWNPRHGILVGKREHQPAILITDDAGKTWRDAALPEGIPVDSCCWKVHLGGHGKAHVSLADTATKGLLLATSDRGRSWSLIEVTGVAVPSWDLQGIVFAGGRGWVGQNKGAAYETSDNGASWQKSDVILSNLNRFALTEEGIYASGAALYLLPSAKTKRRGGAAKAAR